MSNLGYFVITKRDARGVADNHVVESRGAVIDSLDAFWSDLSQAGPVEFTVDLVMGQVTEWVIRIRHPRAFDVADVGKTQADEVEAA